METDTITNRRPSGGLSIRSAGCTLRGSAHAENCEYIYRSDFPGHGRIRGLFAIAEGISGDRERASELSIETLAKCLREIKDSDSMNGGNLLPGCLEQVHSHLLAANRASGNGNMSAYMACGYIEGETAHISVAGGGAVYLLANGKISRLTEDVLSPDLDGADPALLRPGQVPAGYARLPFKPIFISQPLAAGNALLFCSDSFTARVDALKIQNIIDSAATPDEAAHLLAHEAHRRDDSEDVGVVLAVVETPPEPKPAQTEPVLYPRRLYIAKYIIAAFIASILGAIIAITPNKLSQSGDNATTREPSAAASHKTAAKINPKAGVPQGPFADMVLQVAPPNAWLFIDGFQQAGESPFNFVVPADRDIEIRIEANGFEPFTEKLRPKQNTRIERIIKLVPRRPVSRRGSLLVMCKPACDEMKLDARNIEGFPRDEILLREISPGPHRIQVWSGGETEGRVLRIEPGITQSLVFRFANEKIPAGDQPETRPQKPANTKPIPQKPPESVIVHTRPETETDEDAGKKPSEQAPPIPENPPALESAFFSVDTNVGNCTVMVLRNMNLVLSGFSGVRYDVKPGRYLIVVSKTGYRETQREVLLDREYQLVHFKLERE